MCGNCGDRHPTVADVRACHERATERGAAEDRGRRQLRRDGANEVTAAFLRRAMTASEAALWGRLRKGVDGYPFGAQVPLIGYVVDFHCPGLRLVVEVDGGSHRGRMRQDRYREDDLRANHQRVVRLPDTLILENLDAAFAIVRAEVRERAKELRRPTRPAVPAPEADAEPCHHDSDPLLCEMCKRITQVMRQQREAGEAGDAGDAGDAGRRPRGGPGGGSGRFSATPGLVNRPPAPPGTISKSGF